MKPQGHVPSSALPGAREGADLEVGAIFRAALVIAVILAGLLVALALFFHHLEQRYPARTSEAAPRVTLLDLPPPPGIRADPLHDLLAVRAAEDRHLNGYAWIDRQQGIAQIPIDRAMALWRPAPPLPANPQTTNSASATELQMRQDKAQESSRVP